MRGRHRGGGVASATSAGPVSSWLVRCGLPALIAALTFLCFMPVLHHDFVNWDDPFYFSGNLKYRGLSVAHLRWMFTTFYMGHYQPLSWLSHAVVYSLAGLSPGAYHLGNLVVHVANALVFYALVLALLNRGRACENAADDWARRGAAAAGALLFAIHPLRVEAVAWATERQEVLCVFFWLCSILAYVRMQGCPQRSRAWWRWYAMSVASFVLSLLSKAAGVMLPLVLLVLDAYPLGRFAAAPRRRRLLAAACLEKVPYVAAAAAATVLVVLAKQADAMAPLAGHGVLPRAAQACFGLCFYLWKTVVPVRLSPLYFLHKPLDPLAWRFVLSAAVVVAVTLATVRCRHRWPWALAAWLAYIGILLPVLGLTQAGPQIAADRYTYLGCLPWAVLAAAGLYALARPRPDGAVLPARLAVFGASAIALVVLGLLTVQQAHVWRDALTLWNHVLSIEPRNPFAYGNRGHARQLLGDLDGAAADFTEAIRLDPRYADAYNSRGTLRFDRGDLDGALADYDNAVRFAPRKASAFFNRANARKRKGDVTGARADYDRALALDAEYISAYNNRGNLRSAQGDRVGALADYSRAIELNPQHANAYNNRGSVRRDLGDARGALADYAEALRLAPPGSPNRAKFERDLNAMRERLGTATQP